MRMFFRNVRPTTSVTEALGKPPSALEVRNYPSEKFKHDKWAFMPDLVDGQVVYIYPKTGAAFKPLTASVVDSTVVFDDPNDDLSDETKRYIQQTLFPGKKATVKWDVYSGEDNDNSGTLRRKTFTVPSSDDEAPELATSSSGYSPHHNVTGYSPTRTYTAAGGARAREINRQVARGWYDGSARREPQRTERPHPHGSSTWREVGNARERPHDAFDRLHQNLGSRDSRLVPGIRSTMHWRPDGNTIALRYHNTDVATLDRQGRITLNSAGFHTRTTKERMNAFLEKHSDSPWQIYSDRGKWILARGYSEQRKEYEFQDGMTVYPNGTVSPAVEVVRRRRKQESIDRSGSFAKMVEARLKR